MKFNKLSNDFVEKTRGLQEVLEDKGRGYSVVEITYNDLIFAVPLRSNLEVDSNGKPKKIGGAPTSFVADVKAGENGKMLHRGLDFQKALLISSKESDFGNEYPLPDNEQKTTLNDNEYEILKQFKRYVDSYVRAHQKDLPYKQQFYRSTLQNYNDELDAHKKEVEITVKRKRTIVKPDDE
ncbi:TPA: hypothetical protein ACGVB5_004685 [Vibrio vulnificus]|uniref:hypothetical protein n=1 Tax=Vibrio vulnificus TaxID=672 RepID=UPI000CCFD7E1|nr:hypothetical protein [Vibrio vulnificus]POB17842.1 hypothetical protein CRN36_11760 [Vibrio vulnificus]HDY8021205.1 hypothetical protein [Vibrio vulnificus]